MLLDQWFYEFLYAYHRISSRYICAYLVFLSFVIGILHFLVLMQCSTRMEYNVMNSVLVSLAWFFSFIYGLSFFFLFRNSKVTKSIHRSITNQLILLLIPLCVVSYSIGIVIYLLPLNLLALYGFLEFICATLTWQLVLIYLVGLQKTIELFLDPKMDPQNPAFSRSMLLTFNEVRDLSDTFSWMPIHLLQMVFSYSHICIGSDQVQFHFHTLSSAPVLQMDCTSADPPLRNTISLHEAFQDYRDIILPRFQDEFRNENLKFLKCVDRFYVYRKVFHVVFYTLLFKKLKSKLQSFTSNQVMPHMENFTLG